MRVKRIVPIAEGEATCDKVDGVADKESLLNRPNCWIPINLAELGHDEVSVTDHVDDQAQFIEKVQREESCHNLSMV